MRPSRRGEQSRRFYWYAIIGIGMLVVVPMLLHVRFSRTHSRALSETSTPSSKSKSNSDPQLSKVEKCLAVWGAAHKDSKDDFNNDVKGCPEDVPPALYDEFTMNGQIGVEHWYKCQTGEQYHKAHTYENKLVEELVDRISKRLVNFYGETDAMLYRAFDAFPIKDKEVVIMGSQRPIYESACIVFGGSVCTTIDFQPIHVNHTRLRTMTIAEYDQHPLQFDAAISISSFEHDGLGRYGDPIRPDGDIHMMGKMKCIVRENGLLFLDKVVWNMHRVYGQVRLPRLIEHWTLMDVFANWEMNRRWTGCDANKEGDYQPILVLKNQEQPTADHNVKVLSRFLDKDPDAVAGRSCFDNRL